MRLLFCGTGWFGVVDAIRERMPTDWSVTIVDPARPIAAQVGGMRVLLPSNGRIDREVIDAADALQLIQQPAVGIDGIDVEYACQRGIAVCNAPSINANAVAQASLLLVLALARRYEAARAAFARGRVGEPPGTELNGLTLGIVGRGRAGSKLEAAVVALGMRTVSIRSTSRPDELDALLATSDFISLHCPLTEQTTGMIDTRAFSLMKPGAFLINCARGAIVDRSALIAALDSGTLAGAGLDTYWEEPWNPDDPLFARDDVITLPHIGGATVQSFARVADIVVDNTTRLLQGEPLFHRVA